MLGLEFRQNSLSIELRREQYDEKLRTESPVDRSDERPLASWGKAQSLMLNLKERPGFSLKAEVLAHYFSSEPEEEVELTTLPTTQKDVTKIFL